MLVKAYYRLAKPGIIYGNALMYAAGFFLASRQGIHWWSFFEGLVGLSLVIGGACVFNNVADRALDAKMERTKNRATVSGKISLKRAGLYGAVISFFGFFTLYYFSTHAALLAALLGFVLYVFVYTPMKPRSPYALFVGAVAGATPPVVGYTAVTGYLDIWAAGLFVALFLWQLPHFIAIATYRYEEYAAAGIPLFAKAPKNDHERKIARQIFAASLVILLICCLGIALVRLLSLPVLI